jgi:hypothetical protein
MGAKHGPSAQLRLTLSARAAEIPPEIERRLIDALADLLVRFATGKSKPTPGGSDERQDP